MAEIYTVKYIRPALEGDALEDREHGQSEVVKIRDAVIRALPELIAAMVIGSDPGALVAFRAARYRALHYLICDIKGESIFNPDVITVVMGRLRAHL